MALAVCWVLACVAGGFFGVLFSFVVKGKSLIRPFSPLPLPDSVLLNSLLVISSQKVGFMINKWQFWETKLAKRANYASSAFFRKEMKIMLVMTNYAKNHVCSHNLPKPRRAISLVQTLYTGSLACLRRRLVSHRFSFSVQKSFILLILKLKLQPFSLSPPPHSLSLPFFVQREHQSFLGKGKREKCLVLSLFFPPLFVL